LKVNYNPTETIAGIASYTLSYFKMPHFPAPPLLHFEDIIAIMPLLLAWFMVY